jgi:hypothetical protein
VRGGKIKGNGEGGIYDRNIIDLFMKIENETYLSYSEK